jgi:hypothetical protein
MKRLRVGLTPGSVQRHFSVSARHGAEMEIAALGRCVDALKSAVGFGLRLLDAWRTRASS